MKFWRQWFKKTTTLEYVDEKETLAILEEDPDESLVPYFNLVICNPDNSDYRKKGNLLMKNCKKMVTQKIDIF